MQNNNAAIGVDAGKTEELVELNATESRQNTTFVYDNKISSFKNSIRDLQIVQSFARYICNFGYKPKNEVLNRAQNIAVASVLMVLTSPIFIIMYIAVLLDSGRPIFYKGERLGKDGKPFHLYKFRTLSLEASQVTADKVLPSNSSVVTRVGKIVRETRFDELPQIWSIFKGDMNLFGPRPVRPEIAEIYAESIRNYDERFKVRPGIIGHAQTFLPHDASKRLRSSYNYILVNRPTNFFKEMVFFGAVGGLAFIKFASIIGEKIIQRAKDHDFREKRKSPRKKQARTEVYIELSDNSLLPIGRVKDISEEAFSIEPYAQLQGLAIDFTKPHSLVLKRETPIIGKFCIARCKASLQNLLYRHNVSEGSNVTTGQFGSKGIILAHYIASSDLHRCLIDRDFVGKSFVPSI